MKKLKVLALALVCAVFSPAKADEGMWLLQLMQEQNLADRMKAQGLKMDIMDIYNPDQINYIKGCCRNFRTRMYR